MPALQYSLNALVIIPVWTANNSWYVVTIMCCPYSHVPTCTTSIDCPILLLIGSVDMLKDVVVVLVLLLILAGDVELNPGPGKCELYIPTCC